jgi:hypothetical protein
MSDPSISVTPEVHRRLAVDCFNTTWQYLDKPDRTREDDDTMLHMAHASRHHWGVVGTPVNLGRGEWQISRVYAVLGRAEPALHHARRYLEICEENKIGDIGDFDLAFAYEALARGYAVAGDKIQRDTFVEKAREAGKQIVEDDDRELLASDLASIPEVP